MTYACAFSLAVVQSLLLSTHGDRRSIIACAMRLNTFSWRPLGAILLLTVFVGLSNCSPLPSGPFRYVGTNALNNQFDMFTAVTTPCPYVPYPVDLPQNSKLSELLDNMTASLDFQFRTTEVGTPMALVV